jgi:hypothetical protein
MRTDRIPLRRQGSQSEPFDRAFRRGFAVGAANEANERSRPAAGGLDLFLV